MNYSDHVSCRVAPRFAKYVEVFPMSESGPHEKVAVYDLNSTYPILVPPAYPRHGTLAARVLAYLFMEQRIGEFDGYKKLKVHSLRLLIRRLQDMGWPIEIYGKKVFSRRGRLIIRNEFSISAAAIERTGERGSHFVANECVLMEFANIAV